MLTVPNLLLIFSAAHLLNSICGQSVGDSCTIESIPGICKRSPDCQQLSEYVKRGDVPPEFFGCGVATNDNLICCPNAPLAKKTILKKLEPTLVWTQPKKTTTERATEKACRLLEDNIIGNPNIRLFSGSESIVELGEFPFMVGIGYKNSTPDRTYDILCGGTLIDAKFVLTAAHCITGHGNTPIIVRLGVTNNTDVEQIKNGLEIPIKKIHVHPQYDPELIYNDIGLLELEKSAKFSVNIYPTCLYTNIEDPPANSQLYITGWASTKIFDIIC
ncbi:serine protease persephone-like isoform X2 [Teleopsis dalmanni]|uniref:serine protease persephone-like isoform X2 n=1 Tax=Teleopsis dalmanni TaxID=139649 RepID=UPI0018CF2277|nr:serine protease persephone-like isoform X2 [Teleopsis dalmanni]